MKLISWNVNGIRSAMRKGFEKFVKKHQPDVICLQEVKASQEEAALKLPGYEIYWNAPERKGYSGTAILTKIKPLRVLKGIGIKKHDGEGRVLTAEFKTFFLVDVYVPNSKRGLERLPYRTREWDVDFLKYLKKLEKKKPVIFCGDLNVAHAEIDLTNPRQNVKNHGFTPEERKGFENFLKAGFIDTFRAFEKRGGHYTWWSQLGNCRTRNIGWRIDYFLASSVLQKKFLSASILKDVKGSDHCPVELRLK